MRAAYLTVFFLICFSAMGQVDQFQKDIIEYLNSNGTRLQYNQAYEAVFPLLAKNFKDFDIPEKEWQKLKKDKKSQVDEVIRMLSFAYRKHFTQQEINQMKSFYSSEVAKKMLAHKTLSEEENKIISQFFESEVGKKIVSVGPNLTQDIEQISTEWSKELFSAKMSELIKDGYVY